MIQITVCRSGQFQGAEADVVEGFVIDAEGLIGVFDELVDGKGGIVGLDDGVGDLEQKFGPQRVPVCLPWERVLRRRCS